MCHSHLRTTFVSHLRRLVSCTVPEMARKSLNSDRCRRTIERLLELSTINVSGEDLPQHGKVHEAGSNSLRPLKATVCVSQAEI